MLLSLIVLIAVLVVVYFLFVGYYPSFGGDVSKERQTEYVKSSQFHNKIFENTKPVNMDMSFSETLTLAKKFFFTKVENGRPKNNISVQKIDSTNIANYVNPTRFVWFGHSSFLLQMNHKNILIDPMFGDVPAPIDLLGGKRFSAELPIEV